MLLPAQLHQLQLDHGSTFFLRANVLCGKGATHPLLGLLQL